MAEPNDGNRKQHWEGVYRGKVEEAFSWFQLCPELSLALIQGLGIGKSDAVIDIGGGASRLADALLEEGFSDVTVLDIAASGLETARKRLGARADRVRWIEADVTRWKPDAQYRVWHDRAVFHFLVDPADQAVYLRNLEAALLPGASVLIATFGPDGPERCSGLPVQRYSPESLALLLGPRFRIQDFRHETHRTPSGALQRFQYSVFEYEPVFSSGECT